MTDSSTSERSTSAESRGSRHRPRSVLARYSFGVALAVAAYLLKRLLEPLTGTGAPFVLFFGTVVVTSIQAGTGPAIITALLGAWLGVYSFVVRAGFTVPQAMSQGALFSVDAAIVIFLSSLMTRARRAAEVSSAHFRDLIDLAPDAFFLADLEGRFMDVNQNACRMLGCRREDLIGKTILDIIPPEDAPRLAAVRAALLVPGRIERSEWTMKWKDGPLIPIEVSANILPDGRWQAFIRDVSERKRVEDERQVFISLLENSSDFIGIADPAGKPVYVNPAGRRMVGLPPDLPIEQTTIPEYYPPGVRAFAEGVILRSMLEHGRWSGETSFRHWQTGEAIPVSDEHFVIRDPTGNRLLGFGTVTRDISQARRTAREREELLASERLARRDAEAVNQQLRESEERFRLTIDEAPIGMALVSLDGRFVRVNGALCQIVGYTANELEHLRFQDITHPEDLDTDLALLDRLARGEIPRYQLEKRYLRKDGGVVWILLSASILRRADGAPLYYIAQIEDVTERKRAADAIQTSEARFSGIVSLSADAIISVDEDQRIILFNDAAERIFGHARAAVLGAPLDMLIPESLRDLHRRRASAFGQGNATSRPMGDRHATIVGLKKNGERFPAEAAISKLRVSDRTILTVALRDITERKRAEERQQVLADVGAVLTSSLDIEETLTALAHLLTRDLADFCIVDLVERGEHARRLSVVSGDPQRQPLATRFEKFHLDRARPHLAFEALVTRRPFLVTHMTSDTLESLAQNPEHLEILRAIDPRSMIALPLLLRGQLLGALVLISTNPSRVYGPEDVRAGETIADRAAVAIENGRLYQAALRATSLRDEVLAVVAHDLRNPLSAILMQAESLRRRGAEPDRRSPRPRETIVKAGLRMQRLIGDLLDVSLIEAGKLGVEREPVSVRELVVDSIDAQVSLASSAGLALEVDLAPDLPAVPGDRHRLQQVLENLVGNAVKFTPSGGRITAGAAQRPGEVLFWVADTGCGIAQEVLPHVFDRFWQAKRAARAGAGLGLAISRGIVEAHGGRIWVESTLGRGTVFFFTIPEGPAAHPTAPAPGVGS